MSPALDPAPPHPDVATALESLGVEPVSVTAVGGWRPGRTTYRVALADGSVLKARQGARVKAASAAALAAAVGDPCLAAPLAVDGRVTIDVWVDGAALDGLRLTGAHVDLAADLLGRLHARSSVPGHRFPRSRPVAALILGTERRLDELTAKGALGRGDGRTLRSRVRNGLPARAAWGLTHGDFCAANLVVTSGGGLVSVDNESLGFNFLDYDLARTWCRWPMPAWAWPRFARRYAVWGRPVPELDVEVAWRTAAGIKRAHRRHRARASGAEDTVDVLGRVLDLAV